jgi:hypothetical protein
MQNASFVGFIKTIFYIVAIFYILKFLAKLFLPILVKKVVEKAGENFQQQQQQSAPNNSWRKQSNKDEVIIDSSNAKKSRETKKVGDYVDYEELD